MRSKFQGFTTIELITVIAVISILIGFLLPSLNMARNTARNAQQRVQIAAIDQALLAFRNDYGNYPPSEFTITEDGGYGGAQKLAEALLGLDLLGFHPDSEFDAVLTNSTLYTDKTLHERKSRYLELEKADAFLLGDCVLDEPRAGIFKDGYTGQLAPATYVICDVYNRPVEGGVGRAGTPILYYRANPSGIGLDTSGRPVDTIYNYWDNAELVHLGDNSWDDLNEVKIGHRVIKPFYEFITDNRVIRPEGARPWPYRPDSYLLISAGVDGFYGTNDDITNFGY